MNLRSSPSSGLVPRLLREYGKVVRSELRRYLPSKEPRRYLYDLLSDYPRRGGKMMRPALCIATARAFGAPMEAALRSAVAIELLHNALLIHDDIEDESEERRGQPTLHALHGVPLAINAGDTLTLMSLRPLIENTDLLGPELSMRVLEETEIMARESAEGQAMELGWRKENITNLEVADYLEMVLKKTCWLATIYPVRVGALIGTSDGIDLDMFLRFGFFLGTTFQIQDDILNLTGDNSYGKERDGDLWEGKRTLILIHLLEQATPAERLRIQSILELSRANKTKEQICWLRKLIDTSGSIDNAREIAANLARAAMDEFSPLFDDLPDSCDKRFLEDIVPWVIDRR
jgi:geranylgeranyl diphosphate synthase, type II